MYFNHKGGVGDGPYGIQEPVSFWRNRSWAFNPELGSVGTGDYEALQRFIPESNMVIPGKYQSSETGQSRRSNVDPVWRYHKYIGYGNFISRYGDPKTVREYADIAQLINYNQYRSMIEGFSAHMWQWYTGFIIWKTQNPWTALRGQMYDWSLDPNAGLYGLRSGGEPLHIMFNPVNQMIMSINTTQDHYRNLLVKAHLVDISGKMTRLYQEFADIDPESIKNIQTISRGLSRLPSADKSFLLLRLYQSENEIVSENLYWLPDSAGNYHYLQNMPKASVLAAAQLIEEGTIEVTISNKEGNPLAFFIRLSLVDEITGKRILPVFYSDNYISILPGESKKILIQPPDLTLKPNHKVSLKGWNVPEAYVQIK